MWQLTAEGLDAPPDRDQSGVPLALQRDVTRGLLEVAVLGEQDVAARALVRPAWRELPGRRA